MGPMMHSKGCDIQENLIALWTGEGLLLGMDALVVIQTCPVVKRLTTLEAFVWLLASMRSLVDYKP